MKRISCDVQFPDDSTRFGEFANAFRVMPDAGDDLFLDFCLYSAADNRAKVVSRVRVSREFLPLIVDRLRENLDEVQARTVRSKEGVLLRGEGSVILLSPSRTSREGK